MAVDLRISEKNEVFESDTVITSSSQDTNFPDDNIALFSRSKVWRSSGNFVIDATNNKINFDEGGGELTATLTSATYTPTTLATEIKTQMEVAGADTYTITYSASTGKWTLASDGTFSILWKTGTNGSDNTDTHVGTTIGFDDTADDATAASHTGDNIAIHTEETVTFDFITATNIDTVQLFLDPTVGNRFTSSVALTIQANATDSWGSPSVSQSLTIDTDHLVAAHYFASAQSFRYWRLRIVDTANTNFNVEVPSLFLANSNAITQNAERGFSYELEDTSRVQETPFGHLYADTFSTLKTFSLSYKALTFADFELLASIYESNGNTKPITIVIDTLEALFDKDRFAIYGVIKGKFKAKHIANEYFNSDLVVEEII